MIETQEDRDFFRSLVRSIARDGGNFARRKRELAMYRANHIRDYEVGERDVDSMIEGVLCDFPYKVRRALTIKKYYPFRSFFDRCKSERG